MIENYIEWLASLIDCFIVVRFLNRWLPFRHDKYKCCDIFFFVSERKDI